MDPSYSPLFTLGLLSEHAPAPSSNSDSSSAFYFTLRPCGHDNAEHHSFLSLDLAHRKRKSPPRERTPPVLSKASSWTCSADSKSYDFARTTHKPVSSPTVPVVPALRRTSKESLRNIPSPKPVPSATLPDLPISFDHRPRPLPSLAPPSAFKKRPASTVISSPLSPTPRVRRPASLRSESISSHDRRKSRMDALACLEGRSGAPHRVPRPSRRKNFMSFSDDEDENAMPRDVAAPTAPAMQSEDQSAFADVEDEADAIVPALARKSEAASQAKPVCSAKHARKRRSTIDSWFPLKSFIDLKDDDLSTWNWRNFVEIGGVA